MQRLLIIIALSCFAFTASAQRFDLDQIQPDSSSYSNIYVKKLAEDELQSTFIIWIKNEVKPHHHGHHTEYVHVLSGKGIMLLNGKEFRVKKGSAIRIPMNSIHAVKTTSRKPLKVVSVQAPRYDGDRIMDDLDWTPE